MVTSEGAPEGGERRKDGGDSENTCQEVGPCLSASRGDGGWELALSPLFLGDPGLIPDVASSLSQLGATTHLAIVHTQPGTPLSFQDTQS